MAMIVEIRYSTFSKRNYKIPTANANEIKAQRMRRLQV